MHISFFPTSHGVRSYALSKFSNMLRSVAGSISSCWSHNSILPWESKVVRTVSDRLIL